MLKKRSSFFYSIFVPIVLVGIFLMLGFSTFIYRKTHTTLLNNLVEDKQSFTHQVKNNLEQKVRTIEYAYTTYSTTGNFNQILRNPLTYRDFTTVREISSELSYIGVMGIENTEYDLVSFTGKWRITGDGSLVQLTDEQVATYQDMAKSDSTQENLSWVPDDNSIKMIISLPMFSYKRSGIGIADISKSVISDTIGSDDSEFFNLYRTDGTLLYQNGTALKKSLQKSILAQAKQSGTVKDGNNYYIYTRSAYNDWLYLTLLQSSTIQASTRSLKIGLILINLFVLGLLIGIAFLVADRSTKPFKAIQARLVPKSGEGTNSNLIQISQILSGIDDMVSENENLSHVVAAQKPELEQLFVLNLIRNRVLPGDIGTRLRQFSYSFTQQEFFVMLIQIDDLGNREESARDILLLSIEKLVEEIIPADCRFRPIIVDPETQGTIMHFDSQDETSQKQILNYCTALQKAAKEYLRIAISFGISNGYTDLVRSKFAYDNAREALYFRINLGAESIVFYSEIAAQFNETSVMHYPKVEESRLLDAIRSGNNAETYDLFSDVLKKIFDENRNHLSFETALLKLTNNIIQLGQLLGADFEIFQKNRNIYLDVLRADNLHRIRDILYSSLIEPITDTIQDKTDRELRSLSEKIVHIVRQQYDKELSLEIIADQLHYNPNYLSSVFKKEFGSNFGDYLQNYRLEIAKKWLSETELTVKEISQRLQYNNPQNFIRFFKKKKGLTPGEYRKNLQR